MGLFDMQFATIKIIVKTATVGLPRYALLLSLLLPWTLRAQQPDGSLDTGFLNGLDGANLFIYSLSAQPDGKVLIGGDFTTVNGQSRNYFARINIDGSLDMNFLNGLSGANSTVESFALQSDGKVVIGGWFSTVNGQSRNALARLNTDGSLDTNFLNGVSGVNGLVKALAIQLDGKLILGGVFSTVNGQPRNYVARLNTDGNLDTNFLNGLSGTDNAIYSLAVQPDGKVLIGGFFITANGQPRNRIARLNVDGTLDTNFLNAVSGADNSVLSIVLQPDKKVLIGGYFTTVNNQPRKSIARLNADGTLDGGFLNGLSGAVDGVRSIAVQSDGRILIGGDFTTINGQTLNRIARLNADGSLDASFLNGLSGANNGVRSFAVQADGNLLIGGGFTFVNGQPRNRVARLINDTDGDGISGGDEISIYGTNPLASDTDSDGMLDGWEIQHALNPLVDDAKDDLDLDGVTNLQEYLNGLDPRNPSTAGNGKSDYENLFGLKAVKFHYDRNNRLISADYNHGAQGFGIGYVYDGNGNIIRQKSVLRDANTNGLPDVWEFLNGLTNSTSRFTDTDGDGWSDYQEWRAGSSPLSTNSLPDALGLPGTNLASLALPFTPTNFVVGVGQLDDFGAEELVIGADGDPGNTTNYVLVLTQTSFGWSTQQVTVGPFGVTSLCIGQVTNRPSGAIYAGLRQNGGLGQVVELVKTGGTWVKNIVATSTNSTASVLGILTTDNLVVSFSPSNGPSGALYSLKPGIVSTVWSNKVLNLSASRSLTLGNTATRQRSPHSGAPLRLLANTNGLQIGNSILPEPASSNRIVWHGTALSGGVIRPSTTTNIDGSVDTIFNPGIGPNLWVKALAVQSDGKVLIGGPFTTVNGQSRNHIARLNMDGSLDTSFLNGLSGTDYDVTGILLQQDGKIVIGGYFTIVNGEFVSGIARLNSDGNLDTNFNAFAASVNGLAQQPEGKIYGFGSGGSLVWRLNSDGTPDGFAPPSFNQNAAVNAVAVQSDGKILIGGDFYMVGGVTRYNLARLDAYGAVDYDFTADFLGGGAMAIQPDGKIITWSSGGGIRRLTTDGRIDASFHTPFVNDWISALTLQTDGKLLIGGNFNAVNGQARSRVARLNADGSLDTSFNPGSGANGFVTALVLQPNGKMVIGGNFTNINGEARNYVARLSSISNDDADGDGIPNDTSVLYAYADDRNADGTISFGDDFVVAEFTQDWPIWRTNTLSRTSIMSPDAAQSYSLAAVNYTNGLGDILFTGEPDGRVFSWTASSRTAPLQRQVFSAHDTGKAWHGMTGVKTFEPGEGLVGLRVDPTNPSICSIVFWSPQAKLSQITDAPQTAPVARVLPVPNSGGNPASVAFRIWDAEGNVSTPFLQFQVVGSADWTNASIVSVDGTSYTTSLGLAAVPTGTAHTLVWNTAADLGVGVATDVLVRVRARDITLWGEWSAPTPYRVQLPYTETVGVQALADGQLRITISGSAGRQITLQGSPDLFHWANLGLYTNVAGTLVLTNQKPSGRTAYFYRTLQSQPILPTGFPAPSLGSVALATDGKVKFQLNSTPGSAWRLQGSPDLLHWGDYGLQTNQSGIMNITNTPFGLPMSYFYRAKQP
jgi:uncharacterized delta-60 repeat protein